MARQKSEDKRNAILEAATHVVAERGVGATTAAIARSAGVSEGTIFTYFPTKDDLLNTLYREIKLEIADAIMSGFPRRLSVRSRLQHVWDTYVEWGAKNQSSHAALAHISLWAGLTGESRAAGAAPFAPVQQLYREATEARLMRDVPEEYASATMLVLSEMTVGFLQRYPEKAAIYRDTGFEMLWASLARRK